MSRSSLLRVLGFPTFFLAAASFAFASPIQYTMTTVLPPGATDTSLLGINDSGDVVGNAKVGDKNIAFLRTADGNYQTISYPGAPFTQVYGISNSGVILGYYEPLPDEDQPQQIPFLDDHGVFTTKNAYLTNSSGEYVGVDDQGGFLDDNGVKTYLSIPGSSLVIPIGVDDAGDVIGTAYFGSQDLIQAGFILHKNGQVTLLTGGGDFTAPTGINHLGDVVGDGTNFSQYVNGGYLNDGFLYSHGEYTALDFPSGFLVINDEGQIAGRGAFCGNVECGFIATPVPQVPEPLPCGLVGIGLAGVIGAVGRKRGRVSSVKC